MFLEIIKFIIYLLLIVALSKYVLVNALRKIVLFLNLKSNVAGNIAGYATSAPELLTITTSSIRGLASVSIYNILSSNIINFIQYLLTIIINKNTSRLNNMAIKTDIAIVLLTILIPVVFLKYNIPLNKEIIPLFFFLYVGCRLLNNSAHKIYLAKEDNIDSENKSAKNMMNALLYLGIIIITVITLFIISELLGDTLEKMCIAFHIPEFFVGIVLGIMTSIPELITFFESQRYHKNSKQEMSGIVEATNNLLTSNIVNLFAIQTIGILIGTIKN